MRKIKKLNLENIKKIAPLQAYLDRKGLRPLHFSRQTNIHSNTIYAWLNGSRFLTRHMALILSLKTDGELTLKDFGYE